MASPWDRVCWRMGRLPFLSAPASQASPGRQLSSAMTDSCPHVCRSNPRRPPRFLEHWAEAKKGAAGDAVCCPAPLKEATSAVPAGAVINSLMESSAWFAALWQPSRNVSVADAGALPRPIIAKGAGRNRGLNCPTAPSAGRRCWSGSCRANTRRGRPLPCFPPTAAGSPVQPLADNAVLHSRRRSVPTRYRAP